MKKEELLPRIQAALPKECTVSFREMKKTSNSLVIVKCEKRKAETIEAWGNRADRYFRKALNAIGNDKDNLTILFHITNGRDVDFNLYSKIQAPIEQKYAGYEFDPTDYLHGDAEIWNPGVDEQKKFDFRRIRPRPFPVKKDTFFRYDAAIYRESNFPEFIKYLTHKWSNC